MHLAREMERRLERLVDGASAAVFRGRMHPVDMADRLIRQADFVATDGPIGPQIPNHWVVRINPLDFPDNVNKNHLGAELAAALSSSAQERAWRLGGPVAVEVETDPGVPRGVADCSGSEEPGPLPAWAQLISASPPLALDISDNRTALGRALESDVVVNIPEVSRHQAIVVRKGTEVSVYDARSTNGTFVNGERIGHAPHPLVPGDEVTMGDVDFTFRLL